MQNAVPFYFKLYGEMWAIHLETSPHPTVIFILCRVRYPHRTAGGRLPPLRSIKYLNIFYFLVVTLLALLHPE